MTICTRPGCGVDFDPTSASTSDAAAAAQGPCIHHPGAPVFHEGSKSWSCCRDQNKPVLEFDEFLLIKGCTSAEAHTNVKQAKPSFSKPSSNGGASAETNGSASASASVSSATATQPSITPMSTARIAAIQRQNEQRSTSSSSTGLGSTAAVVEEQDPENVDVNVGAPCKRTGCKATFTGTGGERDRAKEECRYHRGVAIFHEGSKGYACCKRRVLEFDEFLTIEPCTQSQSGHLFVGAAAASGKDDAAAAPEEPVDCRIDHYETPADVRVTVYAKGVEMDRSTIDMQEEHIIFSLGLPAVGQQTNPNAKPRRFARTLLPYAAIDVQQSSFTVSRFKIDLVLVKRVAGESWPALERGDQALGYGLTFGRKLDA